MRSFKLAEPRTVKQALGFLSGREEKTFLMAGGTDLFTEIKEGVVEPDLVVDLKAVDGLAFIRKEKEGVRIGAMTSVAGLASDPTIRQEYPVLHQAASSVGTPQLRNMGTVGGNLCQRPRCWYYREAKFVCRKKGGSQCFAVRGRSKYHAIFGGGICHIVYPSDLAPALVALDAEAVILSPRGEKTIPLADFYVLPSVNVRRENVLASDEMLGEVRIPLPEKRERSAYLKLKERSTWDFALVAAAVRGTASGRALSRVRIVLGGVAPIPWRLESVERTVTGKRLTEGFIKEAAAPALQEARPLEENGFKKALAEAALVRSLLHLVSL
ncbi:MAG: xanthine dehydrogenase family protein subunit M [Candidatus Aminicenantes bacterium]|nr:xanthine dehydrogenase family protein subunit M [Candidatus Aminicenantes bacterium]